MLEKVRWKDPKIAELAEWGMKDLWAKQGNEWREW